MVDYGHIPFSRSTAPSEGTSLHASYSWHGKAVSLSSRNLSSRAILPIKYQVTCTLASMGAFWGEMKIIEVAEWITCDPGT